MEVVCMTSTAQKRGISPSMAATTSGELVKRPGVNTTMLPAHHTESHVMLALQLVQLGPVALSQAAGWMHGVYDVPDDHAPGICEAWSWEPSAAERLPSTRECVLMQQMSSAVKQHAS